MTALTQQLNEEPRMTDMIIRRFGSLSVLILTALFVISAGPTASIAHSRAPRVHSRKSAHSVSHKKGNRHAKLSSKQSQTLSSAEKSDDQSSDIGQKIKQLAKSSMISDDGSTVNGRSSDDSVIAAEASSLDIQAEIAEAAKEEQAEDDVDVSIEQFFQARPGSIDEDINPSVVRERQKDYTLYDESDPEVAAQRSDVMAQIIDWMGTKYQFGGLTRSGIDCSAFTRAVFSKSFGFTLPRTAVMQAKLGDQIAKSDLQFGDLVFFHTAGYAPITHVGIYIGEGLFANAACSKGVSVASLSSSYWSKHYVGARRLFTNSAMASLHTERDANASAMADVTNVNDRSSADGYSTYDSSDADDPGTLTNASR